MDISQLSHKYANLIASYLDTIIDDYNISISITSISALEDGIYEILYLVTDDTISANIDIDELLNIFSSLKQNNYNLENISYYNEEDNTILSLLISDENANIENINKHINEDESEDYDILGLLPREILLETIKYTSVVDIVQLCKTNKQYRNLCRNWIDILRFKYPEIKFDDQGNKESYNKLKYLDNHDYNSDMIIWVAGRGYLDIVKYLISLPEEYNISLEHKQRGRRRKFTENKVMQLAMKYNYPDMVKYLISLSELYKLYDKPTYREIFLWAANKGYVDILKDLILLQKEYGINLNKLQNIFMGLVETISRLRYKIDSNLIKYLVSMLEEYKLYSLFDMLLGNLSRRGILDMIQYLVPIYIDNIGQDKLLDNITQISGSMDKALIFNKPEVVRYFLSIISKKYFDDIQDRIIKWARNKGYTDIVEYMQSRSKLYGVPPTPMKYALPDLEGEDILELLPREILLETIKYSSVEDIEKLCRTNKQYSDLCRNWIDIFRVKYPDINIDYNIPASYEKIKYLENNEFDNDMFIWAARNGYLDIIKYLLSLPKKYKIDPAAYDNEAIVSAHNNGHIDIVEYLKSLPEEYNIDFDARYDISLRNKAKRGGYKNVIDYLMRR